MPRKRTSDALYRAARLSRSLEAVDRSIETGNPSYAARRARNVLVGRALFGRRGPLRRLWR